jgi:hypothetical protein
MSQLLYIFFGWFLGLFSPLIIEFFKSHRHTREFVAALKVELEDLQFRLAIASLQLLQSHGGFDRDFAAWVSKIADRYSGDEPSEAIRKLLRQFLDADEKLANQFAMLGRAQPGVGSSLKKYETKFLESNLVEIIRLPITTQRKIHEFRNQLSILNQDITKADSYMMMTFNSSLSEENHKRVTKDLTNLYGIVQGRCKSLADKIEMILTDLS